MKKAPHYSIGLETPLDLLDLINALDHNISEGLKVSFASVGQIPRLHDVTLHFRCKTQSKWPKYLHAIRISDVQNSRYLPLMKTSWLFNREIEVFADIILDFIQGLVRYTIRQKLFSGWAKSSGIPVEYLPASLGWDLKDWERDLKVPELGTTDIVSSYMYHIWKGTLSLDE